MAGNNLYINYEGVDSVVNDMRTYEENINTIYSDMSATVESLVNNGYMEAETADAYINEFKELVGPDIIKMSEVLSTFYTQLAQVKQLFIDHDRIAAANTPHA